MDIASFLRRPQGQTNIRLTWEAELARILLSCTYSRSDSKMRDKPLTQVEAIVRTFILKYSMPNS